MSLGKDLESALNKSFKKPSNDKEAAKEEQDAKVLETFSKSEANDLKKEVDAGRREINAAAIDLATGNEHYIIDEIPEHLPDGNIKMKNKVVALDPMMLPIQRFNKNKFTVVWQCQKNQRPPIKHLKGTWVVFPDHYWMPWIEFVGNTKLNGTPIHMKTRIGKDIDFKLK